jgi:hypothetical protein
MQSCRLNQVLEQGRLSELTLRSTHIRIRYSIVPPLLTWEMGDLFQSHKVHAK